MESGVAGGVRYRSGLLYYKYLKNKENTLY